MPVLTSPTAQQLWTLCKYQPMKQVADKYQMTVQGMVAMFQQEGLMRSGRKCPSPAEIEAAKKEIQAKWDEATCMERWVGRRGRRLV